jgi:hypothetical protein
MGRACSTSGANENACRISMRKPEVKRPLGRPKRRWADNIKMDLRLDLVVCTGSIWLRITISGGLL